VAALERGPALRYYESLVGSWSGEYTFAVIDWGGVRSTGTLAQRLSVASMALMTKVAGPSRMATTLAEDEPGRSFVHTTRVSKAGILLFETRETIAIADDGRSLRMAGRLRPVGGREEAYEAPGEIDDTATRATYRIPWFGVELLQRTKVEEDGRALALSQETPWLRAEVLLRRA
jgi:hypothetical protein